MFKPLAKKEFYEFLVTGRDFDIGTYGNMGDDDEGKIFPLTWRKIHAWMQILNEWLQCQMQWLYLEPIFTSEDIMSQMPTEGRRFKHVDGVWRKIMEKLAKNADALTVGGDEDTYKLLQESNKDLDFVQKGLNDYLETKRLAFPR